MRNSDAVLPRAESLAEWGRFRAFMWGRVGVGCATLAAMGVASWVGGATRHIIVPAALVCLLMALTIPYRFWAKRRQHISQSSYVSILACDCAMTAIGGYFLGGSNAVYGIPIFAIFVSMAASVVSWSRVFVVAALGAVFYGLMSLAGAARWIPEQPSVFSFRFEEAWTWMTVVVNTFAVFATAFIAGALGNVTRREMIRSRELEARLRETNASLAQKNIAIEDAMRQVDLFARAVSHDLRNPITAAGESVRLARASNAQARERLLQLGAENLMRADQMLVGLRNLIRAKASRATSENVNVRSVVEEVIAEFDASSGGVEPTIRIVGELSVARIDAVALGHVFRNLIGNAIEHNRGRPRLQIEVGRDRAGAKASFYVRDDGYGIPSEFQKKIFEAFQRCPNGAAEGLGLGLALVETIVANAGGTVWVESVPGQGATFSFSVSGGDQRVGNEISDDG